MRETKKSKIVAQNALNKKGKNASMKSKQKFEVVKEKERHVPRLLQNRRRAYGKKKEPESQIWN